MGSRAPRWDNRGMNDILASFALAFRLIGGGDPELWRIVGLSLEVSLASAVLACALGLPLGGLVGVRDFPGRRVVVVSLNALLGLPSVVVGLVVYLLLSRAGPLGPLGILFTPTAIVIAQTLLVLPIVAALARQFVEDAWREYREQLTSLGVSTWRAVPTLLWDLRFSLLTVVLAGFGRAASEVGAVMIVGGNIDGVTRVMTTAIALETSKGDLPLALALGVILITVVLALNAAAFAIREWSVKSHG
jgi:tungstate transport system permease protein